MQEQVAVMKQLNSFLQRRGLRANFLAQQVGISEASLSWAIQRPTSPWTPTPTLQAICIGKPRRSWAAS